jgi:hypothetical protein
VFNELITSQKNEGTIAGEFTLIFCLVKGLCLYKQKTPEEIPGFLILSGFLNLLYRYFFSFCDLDDVQLVENLDYLIGRIDFVPSYPTEVSP